MVPRGTVLGSESCAVCGCMGERKRAGSHSPQNTGRRGRRLFVLGQRIMAMRRLHAQIRMSFFSKKCSNSFQFLLWTNFSTEPPTCKLVGDECTRQMPPCGGSMLCAATCLCCCLQRRRWWEHACFIGVRRDERVEGQELAFALIKDVETSAMSNASDEGATAASTAAGAKPAIHAKFVQPTIQIDGCLTPKLPIDFLVTDR